MMNKGIVKIAFPWEKTPVAAEIYGAVAVTKAPGERLYRITHVKSGYAMGPHVTHAKAIKIAIMIAEHESLFTGLSKNHETARNKAAGLILQGFFILCGARWY
jgi:hypothetical protein